jgi:hypothetical protein
MDIYICLFVDGDDAIIASTTIATVNSLAEAKGRAFGLMRQAGDAAGFELWRNGDKVFVHEPERDPDSTN